MSKILFLGDLHMGARNSSNHFSSYFNHFFEDVLYPYCIKHKITNIIQLGDIMDNRSNLVYKALHRSRDIWFGKMKQLGIKMTILLGNHDICYKHSLQINSPELLLGEYDHINIINSPTQIEIHGTKIDIIPWMCDENETAILEFINRKDKSPICAGHFEFAGFPLYKGTEAAAGASTTPFSQYGLVFSGHYHTRSEKDNIIYTGIPYEITWADYNDPKGFYVYDTKTKKYEFVRNHNTMFEKITYNNGSKADISKLTGKIIKVIVVEKKDPIKYERWLDSIRAVSPYELSIIENNVSQYLGSLDDKIEITDTPSVIKDYISGLDTSVSKDDLNKYMQLLYTEALTLNDTL